MKKLLFKTLLLAGLVATVAACNSGSKSGIKCETTDVPGEIGGIYTVGDYLTDDHGSICVSVTRNDSVPKVDMAEVGTSKYDRKKYVLTLVLEALDEQGNVVDDDDCNRDALVEMKTSDYCLCSFDIGAGDIAKTKSFRLKTVIEKNDKVKDDIDEIIDDVNDVLGMD